MIPNTSYLYNPTWSYAPMIIFIVLTIIIGVYILRSPLRRTALGYSALVAALAGFIYTLLVMISYTNYNITSSSFLFGVNRAFWLFYAIYVAFAFIPGFIAFGKISKQKRSKFGTYVAYFAYLWALVIIVVGLSFTIITALKIPNNFDISTMYDEENLEVGRTVVGVAVKYNDLFMFLYFSNWGLVAASLLLHVIHLKQLHGKVLLSLVTFTALNVFSVIFFVVCMYFPEGDNYWTSLTAIFGVYFALVDMPVFAALIVAIHYGHLWKLDALDDNVEMNSQKSDVKNAAVKP